MYRYENELLPEALKNIFISKNHDYETRNKKYSYTGKHLLLENLVKDWNRVDNTIKTKSSLECFKFHVKAKMLDTL